MPLGCHGSASKAELIKLYLKEFGFSLLQPCHKLLAVLTAVVEQVVNPVFGKIEGNLTAR